MLDTHGRCVIAVSEGIHDADGNLIGSTGEVDSHGNAQLSGTGALGDHLSNLIKNNVAAASRVRADTFGYLQRSYFGTVSEQDAIEAREVGRAAVDVATSGELQHGSMAIRRDDTDGYRPIYTPQLLSDVSAATRLVPDEFILGDDDVAEAFVEGLADRRSAAAAGSPGEAPRRVAPLRSQSLASASTRISRLPRGHAPRASRNRGPAERPLVGLQRRAGAG